MLEQILNSLLGADTIVLIALIVANLALSIVAAVQKKVFTFRKLGDFVNTRVLPFVAYLIVAGLAQVVTEAVVAQVAVYAGLIAMYVAAILAALKSITGLNIPSFLSEK